jgi:hypothetical protein
MALRLRRRKRDKPKKPPRIRAAIARVLLKAPFFRRFYLKRLLKHIDETPREKLQPELRELKKALASVPPPRRMAMLESVLEQGPQATETVQQSRQLRRAAERQQRKTRR